MNTLGRKRENPDPSVPPPQGWERHFSSSGQEYFVHRQTDHTQWEYPSQSEVENPIAAKKRRDNAERERADALRQEEKDSSQPQREDAMALAYTTMNVLGRKRENPDPSVPPPQGWERHCSSSGQEYFVHRQTDHTQWEYPSQSEVENPIAAKKRRDNAERERADALRQEEKDSSQPQREDAMALAYTTMNVLGRKRENPDPSVPPPQGWERHCSSSGQEYFVHRQTDHTQWEYPSQSEVENPIAAKKRRDNAERERADALRQEKKKEEKLQRSYLTAIRKRNSEADLTQMSPMIMGNLSSDLTSTSPIDNTVLPSENQSTVISPTPTTSASTSPTSGNGELHRFEENKKVIQNWEKQYEFDNNLSLFTRTDLSDAQKLSLQKGPAQPIRKNPVDESSFDEIDNFAREYIRKEVIKMIVSHPLAKFVPMFTKQCVEVLKQLLPNDTIALWLNHCATQPSRGHCNLHGGNGSYKGYDMSKCCSVIAMKAISEFFRTITSFTCGDDAGDLQLANIRESCLTTGDAFQHCAPGTQKEADALVAIAQLYLDGISRLGGNCLVVSTAGRSSNMDRLVLSRLESPSSQIKIASRSTRHVQHTRTPSKYLDVDESAERMTKEIADLSDEVIQPFLDSIGYKGESFKDFTLRNTKLPFITNSPKMLNHEYDQKWKATKDERIQSLLQACWRELACDENALVGNVVVAEGEANVILTYVMNHVDEMYKLPSDRGANHPDDPKFFSIRDVLRN